jgi:uncharacterized protein (DUF1800 family)
MAESPSLSPAWAWERYAPSASMPWNLQRAGHLYRRAAFGASWSELETAVKDGPDHTISRLLEGGPGQADYNRSMQTLADSIARVNNGQQLAPWWLQRMLFSPHPLEEKLTLFWHNHFATSDAKVQNARFMLGQYDLLRKHALGNFAEVLRAMSTDPAMLIWLDGRDSKKGNPNENYARELMELFSLGIGNYTEKDIREAARAFTGWEIRGTEARFNAQQFDAGEKTVFGKSGPYHPDDIVKLCLEKKSAADFVSAKLFRFLVSETIPATPELLHPLSTQLRNSGYNVGQVVETILRSNLFFAPQAYRTRIKSPVEFALGIVKGLEGRIGTTALADTLQELGQKLFFPPSVKGWDGGPTWLNGQTLLYRQNLALALTSTEDVRFGSRTDPATLARKLGRKTPAEVLDLFLGLFLQNDITPEARARLVEYQRQADQQTLPIYWSAEDAQHYRTRSVCYLVLTQPEFQLA